MRRQFGREQPFGLERIAPKKSVASSPRRRVTGLGRPGADRGGDPVFSDYPVHNRASGSHYRMAIRGRAIGQNFRTCPDFATIDLGTCNHIEFTLAKLESRRGGKAALAALSRCAISLDQRHRKRIRSAR